MLVLLLLPYPTSYLQRNQWSTAKICDVCSENPVDYSIKSIKWLQYISLTQNINIRHACNGREQAIQAHGKTYKVDGYCKETTTIYQFHGCYFHGCKNSYNELSINRFSQHNMKYLHNRTTEIDETVRKHRLNLITINVKNLSV